MSYEVCFYAGSSPPCCFVPAGLSRWLERGRRPVSRDLGPGPEDGRLAWSAARTRPVFGNRPGVGWDGPGDPPHGQKPRPKLGIRLLLGACCWTGSRKLVYPTAE